MSADNNSPTGPQINPGEILNWPMLKINYKTDPEAIAALLPPGINPGKEPNVNITIYNFPVLGEPEYGVVVNIEADYDGTPGEYTLGIGIDQEAAVFNSHERWGQPKYYAETKFYRLMDTVTANVTHRGYTFLEFQGQVTETLENPPEHETNEWWMKHSRGVDMQPESYDFPPHVVHVYSKYGTAHYQKVEGKLTLSASPWDPIATALPIKSEPTAHLWTPIFLDRKITLAGKLDPKAFWPFTDTIGGSRWPGTDGGPKREG